MNKKPDLLENLALVLTFGKHAGKSIDDVTIPAAYKLWLLDNVGQLSAAIKEWIQEYEDELYMDAAEEGRDVSQWDIY